MMSPSLQKSERAHFKHDADALSQQSLLAVPVPPYLEKRKTNLRTFTEAPFPRPCARAGTFSRQRSQWGSVPARTATTLGPPPSVFLRFARRSPNASFEPTPEEYGQAVTMEHLADIVGERACESSVEADTGRQTESGKADTRPETACFADARIRTKASCLVAPRLLS